MQANAAYGDGACNGRLKSQAYLRNRQSAWRTFRVALQLGIATSLSSLTYEESTVADNATHNVFVCSFDDTRLQPRCGFRVQFHCGRHAQRRGSSYRFLRVYLPRLPCPARPALRPCAPAPAFRPRRSTSSTTCCRSCWRIQQPAYIAAVLRESARHAPHRTVRRVQGQPHGDAAGPGRPDSAMFAGCSRPCGFRSWNTRASKPTT